MRKWLNISANESDYSADTEDEDDWDPDSPTTQQGKTFFNHNLYMCFLISCVILLFLCIVFLFEEYPFGVLDSDCEVGHLQILFSGEEDRGSVISKKMSLRMMTLMVIFLFFIIFSDECG